MTSEKILEYLKSDLYSYQEFMDNMIISFLDNNILEKQYWEEWFKESKLCQEQQKLLQRK